MADSNAKVAVQVRQLFDTKATTWSAKYAPGGRLSGRLTRFTTALIHHVPAEGHLLDIGCGTGEIACAIASAGMQVAGCDISPEMLHRAAAADPTGTVDWVQLEPGWRKLPFESATFDVVIASSVLEYVDDPTVMLRECCRVLRPGGALLCTVPDPHHPIRWVEWLVGVVALVPLVGPAGRRWPRLDGYLTYLRISRHRHTVRWWFAVAVRAGLHAVHDPLGAAEHAPLRLMTFKRPDERKDG